MAILLGSGIPARAADPALEELDRLLAAWTSRRGAAQDRVRGAAPEEAPRRAHALRTVRDRLERRFAEQQAAFDRTSRRALPPKARERLVRARAAHAEGQGRLLELLREAAASPDDDARRARLRDLLAPLLEASRHEPLSSELTVRAPALVPPPLPVAGPETERDTATETFATTPAAIGPVPAAIRSVADQLEGPVEAYAWVRNNVRAEMYYGSLKGPLQTLLDRGGNDADTAALLVALLRAKGIPARFAHGTAQVDIARLQSVTGTANAAQALRVLARAGIPHEAVTGPSGVVSVKIARVVCEAYVAYANYRGLPQDAQGKVWLPLDPGFKDLRPPSGLDVVSELGVDATALVDEYLAEPRAATPREFLRQRVTEALAPRGVPYAAALNDRSLLPEDLGILPNALPYVWVGAPQASYDSPLPHEARVVGEWNGATLLDVTLSLPAVLGKRVTLSYVPADADDATVVAGYGSLGATPPYLIEVRPVLKVGGVVVAAGDGAVGMAVKYDLRVTLTGPGGRQEIVNRVLAGNLTAIGLAGGSAGVSETDDSHAAALLSHAASEYLRSWNRSDAELADLWRVVPVRPTASACFVASAVEVEYAGGDPLYPISFDWKGVTVDADLRSSAPVGVEANAAEARFVLVSGLEGSILENRLFEDLWQVGSVSTAKALQLAADAGTTILTLDRETVEAELPGLPLDPSVKEEIREAALRGLRVRVPAAPVDFLAWTGSAWWVLDEETGESAWMLQGGHAGGVTAAAAIDWPDEAIPETLIDQEEEAAPEETPVARIQKFVSTDFQDGVVNKPLDRPLRVLVLDEDGQRIPNAAVIFQVIGGGGVFIDPATGEPGTGEVAVLSNARGEAEATLVLGRSTSEIPRFVCLRDDPESCTLDNEIYATQVGLNLVTVSSGAAVLLEPFSAYGKPDDQFDGELIYAFLSVRDTPPDGWVDNLSVSGLLSIDTLDPYDNPISNFRVRFAYAAPPELGSPPPGWGVARGATTTPGRLLGRRDYERCIELNPNPTYGTCPGEQEVLLARSSTFGSITYPVLGDSPYSLYKYFIGTELDPEWGWIKLGTFGRLCSPNCSSWWGRWPITFTDIRPRPILVGPTGNLIEAHAPGASAPLRFSAFALYEGYTVESYQDEDGNKHYRAIGNNQWTREPLDDTVFTLTPRSPGTGTSGSAGYIGSGVYESQMIMAGTPQLNTVDYESSSTPWLIPRDIPDFPTEVDPAAVDEVTLEITKRKFPEQPWIEPGVFSLWGVKATIDSVTPSPVLLENGRVKQPSRIAHRVEPPAYLADLSPTQLWFLLERDQDLVLAGSGTDGQPFQIPAGLAFPPGDYVGKLSIPGVSGGGQGITSEPFPIPTCQPLELLTPAVVLPYDPGPTPPACETQDRIRFKLCAPSRVTIRVGSPGQSETIIDGLELAPGEHVFELPREIFEGREDEPLPFEVLAVPVEAPSVPSLERGVAVISGDLVTLGTPLVEIKLTVDRDNSVVLGKASPMKFAVCDDVRATIKVDGSVLSASIDGGPQIPLDGILLEAGPHEVNVPLTLLGLREEASEPFEVSAETLSTPVVRGAKTGTIRSSVHNRSILPVGHTFVKGVDVSDGHLVVSEVDLSVPGRHLGLEMSRTYSSSGQAARSPMGAGWNWNYDLNLHIPGVEIPDVEDTLVVVTTRDGTQMFRRGPNPSDPYTPQRGYHGRLVRNTGDVTFDYFDKANVQHRFEVASADRSEYRLAWIREPHGDRLVLTYDGRGNVTKVAEEQDGTPVRELRLTHERVRGSDRIKTAQIVKADGSSLGLRVTYDYDPEWGNLEQVTRPGTNLATGGPSADDRVHRYWYTETVPRDRHQLIELRYANGSAEQRTKYQYYGTNDPLVGESATAPWFVPSREELVRAVYEYSDSAELDTRFTYDWTRATQLEWKTIVRDAKGRNTTYVQNGRGSTVEIEEPLGKKTLFTWNDRVRKEKETDGEDRVTRYGWDGNGNLTSEIVEAGDPLGDVTVLGATYDGRFNKLTSRTDAEGRTTSWSIRETNGDVLSMTDAEGNVTTYEYDGGAANGPGLLTATIDARGNRTTYSAHHPTFGHPQLIQDPLGNRTERVYDERGRLTRETDSFGRRTDRQYDGLDRETRVIRYAESGSDNEITERDYYPLGQLRTERTANGAFTTFTIDDLGRVAGTQTSLSTGVLRTETRYDRVGNKEFEKDRRGVQRRFVYDDLNRLTDVHIESGPAPRPTGLVAKFDYDLVGNKKWERDVAGLQTDFVYDGLYRVTEKHLPEQMPSGYAPSGRLIERFGYDKVGNRTSVTDANGHETRFEYDRLNRLKKTTRDPGGLNLVATVRYCNAPANDPQDGMGVNKCEEHDESRGLRTLYTYDALNREETRTVSLEGPDGEPEVDEYVTETRYADSAHEVRVEDDNGKVTLTRLDGLDRPIEQVVDENGLALRTQIFYDGLGNRKRVVDPRNNPVVSRFDGLSRLVLQTDAFGRSASYDYDGEGLRTLAEDRRDVRTRSEYDNLGRETHSFLESTPYSDASWSRRIEYRDQDRLRIETDARGKTTTFLLDGLGRVIRETDHANHFALTKWDGVNKVEQTDKRPAHHVTKFAYDAINRPTLVKDPPPFGFELVTRYLDNENQVEETDRRGTVKRTQLDALGRVRSITDAVGRPEQAVLERNTYDGVGNKTLGIDAENRRTAFTYDGANRLKTRTDGAPGEPGPPGPIEPSTTSYEYDRSGNREIERDQRAQEAGQAFSIKRIFDRLNRVKDDFDGEGNHTVYDYDREGNRTLVQEPKGQRTTFDYDERGALLTVTQPPAEAGTAVTLHGYDENRNRTSQRDARGNVVRMEYDDLNRLEWMIQPGELKTHHEYDANGNLERVTDPNGNVTVNTYDELNRLKVKTYTLASGLEVPWGHCVRIEYVYDENGNVREIHEDFASGTSPPVRYTTSRVYDRLDRLTSDTSETAHQQAVTVGYSYFRNGLRQTVTDALGAVTAYEYDGQNRLKHARSNAGTPEERTTSYTYWPDSLVKQVQSPNGVAANHLYDRADRLRHLSNTRGGTVISSYAYGYDPNGNREQQTEVNDGRTETTTYGYDALNRLERVTYPVDPSHSTGRTVTYEYDLVGNREGEKEVDGASVELANKTAVFDALNRLTSVVDSVNNANNASFTYDRNGNQLTKTTGAGTSAVTDTYVYDTRNQLVEVLRSTVGPAVARFQYDGEGRRILKIGMPLVGGDSGTRQYVYDETSVLQELDATGASLARYEWGGDRLLSLNRIEGSTLQRRFYSFDGLGSVTNLTDEAGVERASYHLDAWGNFRFPSQLLAEDDTLAGRNRFAFTGYLWDQESELYYAKARLYDPEFGRFTSQDSFLGEINAPPSLHRYFYANANPTRFIDPTGHQAVDPDMPADDVVDRKALIDQWAQEIREQRAAEGPAEPVTPTEQRTETCQGVLCPVVEPLIKGAGWLINNTVGRFSRWVDEKFAGPAAEGVNESIVGIEPSQRLLADRRHQVELLGPEYLAQDKVLGLGTGARETTGELAGAGTRFVVREGVQAIATAGTSRAARGVTEAVDDAVPLARRRGTPPGSPGVPGGDVPYHPRTIAAELEAAHPGQVRSHTMVPNPSGRVLHRGKNILIDQRGFPVFDDVAAFQTRLHETVTSVRSRRLHMQEATRDLNAAINRGEVSAREFTPQQLRAIQSGSDKVPGFTWHHHQERGRMQLIPSDFHQAVGHSGGFKMWY